METADMILPIIGATAIAMLVFATARFLLFSPWPDHSNPGKAKPGTSRHSTLVNNNE